MPPMLEIEIRSARDRVVVALAGDLDLATTPSVRDAIGEVRAAGWDRVVLDVEKLGFIDCQGLNLLLETDGEARTDGWSFALRDGSPAVARLLGATGLGDRFTRADRP